MNFKTTIFSSILFTMLLIYSCKTDDVSTVSTSASVTALNCTSASFSATAVAGTAFTGTATVPYTGGNGVAYTTGTAVASAGVTGLTATLSAGTLATGSGSAIFAITGTPASSGTATFAISLGGQTCTLSLTVATSGSTGGTTTGTSWAVDTDIANIVKLAEAFKASLSTTQATSLQDTYNKAHAQKWSNLPEGLYKGRVGLQSSTFSTAQWTAFYNLLKAATGTGTSEGNDEYVGILAADDYLNSIGGGSDYGSGNYYIAFIGTPSTTGLWCLQIGGHHGTIINTYNGGKMTGGTPSFRSTEPFPTFTLKNVNYNPIQQEQTALSNMLKGLGTSELTSAKRSSAQNDLIAGPQKDSSFPTTKTGVKVGNLTQTQKDLVLAAIKTYTDDLDDKASAAVYAKYKADIDNTYISYYGTTALTALPFESCYYLFFKSQKNVRISTMP